MASSYVCPQCGVDFDYFQGLQVHEEIGCEWGEDGEECDADCLYVLSGNYCPECHRGD
jgi:hypothetical protein